MVSESMNQSIKAESLILQPSHAHIDVPKKLAGETETSYNTTVQHSQLNLASAHI